MRISCLLFIQFIIVNFNCRVKHIQPVIFQQMILPDSYEKLVLSEFVSIYDLFDEIVITI